jgi:hypothetical protein
MIRLSVWTNYTQVRTRNPYVRHNYVAFREISRCGFLLLFFEGLCCFSLVCWLFLTAGTILDLLLSIFLPGLCSYVVSIHEYVRVLQAKSAFLTSSTASWAVGPAFDYCLPLSACFLKHLHSPRWLDDVRLIFNRYELHSSCPGQRIQSRREVDRRNGREWREKAGCGESLNWRKISVGFNGSLSSYISPVHGKTPGQAAEGQ